MSDEGERPFGFVSSNFKWTKNKNTDTANKGSSSVQGKVETRQLFEDQDLVTFRPPEEDNPPTRQKTEVPSFEDLTSLVDTDLHNLLRNDSIMSDIPSSPPLCLEGVEALLAFEAGQGMKVVLKREDGTSLPILVRKDARVRGLMDRIETEIQRLEDTRINWKSIWRQNSLVIEDEDSVIITTEDDKLLLKDLGVTNNSILRFRKRMRVKVKVKGKKRK